jgi:hypothetical protein
MSSLKISTTDNDGSLPAPPQRPTITDPEHAAVAAFRDTLTSLHRARARVVEIHHIDATTAEQLTALAQLANELHAHLDEVDAAWLADALAKRTQGEG